MTTPWRWQCQYFGSLPSLMGFSAPPRMYHGLLPMTGLATNSYRFRCLCLCDFVSRNKSPPKEDKSRATASTRGRKMLQRKQGVNDHYVRSCCCCCLPSPVWFLFDRLKYGRLKTWKLSVFSFLLRNALNKPNSLVIVLYDSYIFDQERWV